MYLHVTELEEWLVCLLTGVFASKSVNSVVGDNEGLIFGDTTLFLNQLTALVIVSVFFSFLFPILYCK
jgi:hypothetical protein